MKQTTLSSCGHKDLCIFMLVVAWAAVSSAAAALTAASYAQDGLVGQWDGIENAGAGLHDPATNYWSDLTGQSGDFAVYTSCAAFTENGLKKNAAGIMATNVTATARTDVRTIEVVVSGAPSSGWVNALLISENQTATFSNDRGGYRECFFDYQNFGWQTTQKPAQETLTVTYSSATAASSYYQNGAKPAGTKKTNYWSKPKNTSAMHIGGRSGYNSGGDWTTTGYTIHAIRLYSRVLTQAEIRRAHAGRNQATCDDRPDPVLRRVGRAHAFQQPMRADRHGGNGRNGGGRRRQRVAGRDGEDGVHVLA